MLSDMFREEAPGLTYVGHYTYRVAADSTGAPSTTSPAGRINLEPLEKGMPTIPRVDQWPGVAGCTSFPAAGSLVIVGFRDSRPDRPFIQSFVAARMQGGVPLRSVVDASELIKVGPSATLVELAGGSAFVALSTLVASELSSIATVVGVIAGILNTPGPVTGATGAVTPYVPGSVAATKVKAT